MASHSPKRASPRGRSKPREESKADARMNAINNNVLRASPRRQAAQFAEWYRALVDSDRAKLCLFLAEDATLQWFGRTVKRKKQITGFLKFNMHCTSHRFTSVEVCGQFVVRGEEEEKLSKRKLITEDKDEILATPLNGETPTGILNACLTRVSLRSLTCKRSRAPSSSPESPEAIKKTKITTSPSPTAPYMDVDPIKDRKTHPARSLFASSNDLKGNKEIIQDEESMVTVLEEGQGDCFPSTSGMDLKRKRDQEKNEEFYSQLPHSYVEARCVIEFTKSRVKRGADILKWQRHCKVQVAYTEDPLFAGEYIIWTIVYSDNNKCRRNLLADFEAAGKECEKKL